MAKGGDGITKYQYIEIVKKYGKKFICEKCGLKSHDYKKSLAVHHKDRNKKNNLINNLEILCDSCHMKEHLNEINSNRGVKNL